MISDPERTTLISSIGWVDHDALWHFDVSASRVELIALGTGARHLPVHSSRSRFFSVGHHFDGARFELTVHSFADPRRILAHAILKDAERKIMGDASVWGEVPLLYVEYLRLRHGGTSCC